MTAEGTGALHHVELWVPDFGRAERSWGWLLTALGYTPFQQWSTGAAGGTGTGRTSWWSSLRR